MKRIVFGQLVTMAEGPDGTLVENGELMVDGGRIVEVRSTRSDAFAGETVDLSGHLLLPGFVNAHCHLSLTGLAGKIAPGLPFVDWIRQVVQANEALPFTGRLRALREGAQALSASGVTSLVDYVAHTGLIHEYAGLPLRSLLLYEVIGFSPARAGEITSMLDDLLKNHPKGNASLKLGLAAHAPYSVSPALLQNLKVLAAKYRCPLSCHVSEVPEEVAFLRQGNGPFRQLLEERKAWNPDWAPPGVSPVAYLSQLGVLEGVQAVHLNCVEMPDILPLAGEAMGAVFCPGSTRWFGRNRWMPVRELLDAGLAVGLGTDSVASNESLDFMREIRLAGAMLPEVSRAEILWMATAGGALASGLEAGRIVPGGMADVIAFKRTNVKSPWWDTVWDHPGSGPDAVMLKGEWVAR